MTAEPENIECPSCGAMMRSGASFCFKCGKHYELVGAQPTEAAAASGKDTGELTEPVPAPEFHETVPDINAKTPVEAPRENVVAFPSETASEPEPLPVVVKAKPELTSAAALRRKPKPQREKLEMVWEQPEGNTNPVFVGGTIVIFILVLVILGFVYYLK